MTKNNMINMKVSFENIPIIDSTTRVKNGKEFDDMIKDLRQKLFGRDR